MRHDWATIRNEYVMGGSSLRELAQKYNVSPSNMFTHAARDGWVEEREQNGSKMAARARERAQARKVRREADALLKVEDQIDRLIAEIEKALADETQLYRHVIYVGKGKQGERTLKKLDTKAARDYVAMLAELKSMLDSMGGVLDKRVTEDLKLKRARLRLDKQKFGLLGESADAETGVAIVPEVSRDETPTLTLPAIGADGRPTEAPV